MLRSLICYAGFVVCTQSAALAQCGTTTIPGAPAQVFAEDATNCTCTFVHWTPVSGFSDVTYRIWRAIDNDYDTIEMIADMHAGSHFADFDAPSGVECTYWVQSITPQYCVSELSESDNGERRPDSPVVTAQPDDVVVSPGTTISFEVETRFASSVQWRRDKQFISDDEYFQGASTDVLTIIGAGPEHVGHYDAVVTDECGEVETTLAKLIVGDEQPCAICAADYDSNSAVLPEDLEMFFSAWSDGARCADVNRDGGIDGSDIEEFLNVWSAGGC